MPIEKRIRDRAFTKDDLLTGTNNEIAPVLRITREAVNQLISGPQAISSALGVLNINWSTYRHYQCTLTESIISIVFTHSAHSGGEFAIRFIQGSDAFAVTGWPSTVHWVGGVEPTMTSISGRSDLFKLYYDGTNYWTEVSQNYV
jgi:hypothetical protein